MERNETFADKERMRMKSQQGKDWIRICVENIRMKCYRTLLAFHVPIVRALNMSDLNADIRQVLKSKNKLLLGIRRGKSESPPVEEKKNGHQTLHRERGDLGNWKTTGVRQSR